MKGTPVAPQEVATAFSASIEGTWFVKTGKGILSMSLDELDQAFQTGEVDAATAVFTSGMEAWDTLGHVANLNESRPEDGAAPEQITDIGAEEIDPEPSDGGSFAPTTTGVFGPDGAPWASIVPPDGEGHTAVRRSPGFVPYAIRRAAGRLADLHASVRRVHPRLGAVGPWLFGAVLSAVFVFSLYQMGNASTPAAKRQGSPVVARVGNASDRPAPPPVAARPATIEPSIGSLPSTENTAARSPERSAATSPASEREDDSLTTVRTNQLKFAKTSRAETSIAGSSGGKSKGARAKGAKSSASKKAKSRASRKFAKKSSKRRAASFE
jgi:hypothetical protein